MNGRRPSTCCLALLSLVLAVALGCNRAASSSETTTPKPQSITRLELGIRLTDGRWLELGDLRGTPVLLFVFATFDAVSQASLKILRPFVPQHPDLVVIGIAAQPRASQLVDAWAYALDPPFVVGADPTGRVENGESRLGKIEAVPTFILYGADGYEVERKSGLLTEGELAKLVRTVEQTAD